MTWRRRLERLEQAVGKADEGPEMLVYLAPGQWFWLADGEWLPWPQGKAAPKVCKVYGFFPVPKAGTTGANERR